jgi:hypothetical protein
MYRYFRTRQTRNKKTASFEAVFVPYLDKKSNTLLEDFDKFYDLFEEKTSKFL